MSKQSYSINEYLTKPIVAKISYEENVLREELMNEIITKHEPISITNHPQKEVIDSMIARNIMSCDCSGDLVSIYPVSATQTNKKVIFEDGTFAYAMCALDALGFHYTFQKPIRIESECEHSAEKVILTVRDGKIEVIEGGNDIHVLHADLENTIDWSCSCCNIMHFFSSETNISTWVEEKEISSKIFKIDLETANKISWLLFSK